MQHLRHRGERAELRVVALAVAGQQHPQRVVEVVGPDAVAAVAADHLRVVEAGLGDHDRARIDRVHPAADRGHEVLGVGVHDRVDRVQPQAVDVEVADPLLRALEHPLADRVGVAVVVVHRLAPRRLVVRGEVGAEALEPLHSGGSDVVVDDVEQHREALAVGGVDEPLQALRPAVGVVRRADVDAVVAPAVAAGEGGQRHQLDRRDAELAQPGQVLDRGVERALRSERADVQLVEHRVAQGRRLEAVVGPAEGPRVEQPRAAAQAVGLPARRGVGELDPLRDERVVLRRARLHRRLQHAVAGGLELVLAVAVADPQHHVLAARRPDAELRAAVAEGEGAEAALEWVGARGHLAAGYP